MKRARKSNRVSWATGGKLCQVKLFLSEDCPSKVGQKLQDHLQAKTSSNLIPSINESYDLPPGFEGNHFLNQSKVEFPHISQTKWECPPLFTFSYHWRVAAGEESREKEDQKLREMRVLEAVYPRLSAIPPSPSVSLDVEEEDYDDNLTPLIPIIPIEEEESMGMLPELAVALNPPSNVQSQNLQQYVSAATPISSDCTTSRTVSSPASGMPLSGIFPGMDADLAAAASAVVAAIMKSNEQGNLIDMDLLVKILNDPIMIEKLVTEHITAASTVSPSSNTVSIPSSGPKPAIASVPLSTPTPDVAASGITPTSKVGLLPSGLKSPAPSISLLKPTPDKPATLSVPAIPSVSPLVPAIPSVSLSVPAIPSVSHDKTAIPAIPSVSLSVPATPSVSHDKTAVPSVSHDKPATPLVPLSKPMSGKPATPPISLPTPAPAHHMHRPVSKNIHHLSNGMPPPTLNTQSPPQDIALASGVKLAASLASMSSCELSSVPLSSATGSLHAIVNQVQSTAMSYQPSTCSSFAVKDADYYKNLIRQHGADRQDKQDSQIGIPHSNIQDMKRVLNIKQGEVKPKIQKPCIYFKSSRGCRNGTNCPFQHDMPVQWGASTVLGAQNAKRLKLGQQI